MLYVLFTLWNSVIANAVEIDWPGDTIVVTCDDHRQYKLRIKTLNEDKVEDWVDMIIETKCKGNGNGNG